MIKGTQRQMVMVRTEESSQFEMAYFVLRADRVTESERRSMLDEANSIVSAACRDKKDSKRDKMRHMRGRILFFCLGVLCGAVILGAIFALIFLL